jgi:hypothetical protein
MSRGRVYGLWNWYSRYPRIFKNLVCIDEQEAKALKDAAELDAQKAQAKKDAEHDAQKAQDLKDAELAAQAIKEADLAAQKAQAIKDAEHNAQKAQDLKDAELAAQAIKEADLAAQKAQAIKDAEHTAQKAQAIKDAEHTAQKARALKAAEHNAKKAQATKEAEHAAKKAQAAKEAEHAAQKAQSLKAAVEHTAQTIDNYDEDTSVSTPIIGAISVNNYGESLPNYETEATDGDIDTAVFVESTVDASNIPANTPIDGASVKNEPTTTSGSVRISPLYNFLILIGFRIFMKL